MMRSHYKLFIILISFLLLVSIVQATTDYVTATGSWTAPTGVKTVNITIVGGGGGGAGGNIYNSQLQALGGSAGTSTTINNFPVTAGTSYPITIGIGGNGGLDATNGNVGLASSFNTVNTSGGGGGGGFLYNGAYGGGAGGNGFTSVSPYINGTAGTASSGFNGGPGGLGYGAGGGGGGGGQTSNNGHGGRGADGIVAITYTLPTIAFIENESSGSVPFNVLFTDRTSESPNAWNWSFGDGTYSNSQNPTHVYSNPGFYNVTLNASSSSGYSISTFYKCIIVGQAPQTNSGYKKLYLPFNGTDGSSAVRDYSLSNNTIISMGYAKINTTQSKFGGGSLSFIEPSPSGITSLILPYNNSLALGTNNFYFGWWENDTSYIYGGVTIADRRVNYSHITDGMLFGYNGNTVIKQVYGASLAAWDFVTAQTLMAVPTCKTWNYYVFLRNGTSLQTWKDGVLQQEVVIAAGTPVNNTHRPIYIGSYNPGIGLGVSQFDGMIDDFVIYNGLAPNGSVVPTRELLTNPTSVFVASNNSGRSPVMVNFTDASVGNTMTSWNWSFGDGTYSNAQNPNHLYIVVGNYTVTLNVTNNFGSSLSSQFINVSSKIITNFTSNVTTGILPVSVQFNDSSTNSTGWAWFFGDENYTQPWVLQNSSGGWTPRYALGMTALPNGHIVIAGGLDSGSNFKNDVWRSIDNGSHWTLMNSSTEFSGRMIPNGLVARPDGSLMMLGGRTGAGWVSGVWRSIDEGNVWIPMTGSPGFSGRYAYATVVMPDGSVILMGGTGNDATGLNDTWKMASGVCQTWTQMNASSGWSARWYTSAVVLSNGHIVLAGGYNGTSGVNDVWKSIDSGSTWTRVNASAGWSPRWAFSMISMPDDSIVLFGGGAVFSADMWRSTDEGSTWIRTNTSVAALSRWVQGSALLPDGRIVMAGGLDQSSVYKNDTYLFNPVGSSLQNPTHTYQSFGFYNVSLQTRNTFSFNTTQLVNYMNIHNHTLSGFTANVTSGVYPLNVAFNVTHPIDNATQWNWSFGDGTWQNGTTQNVTHVYPSGGIFTVTEISSEPPNGDIDITTLVDYIKVDNQTISGFVANSTTGITPGPSAIGFNVTMPNDNATFWNWSFGDGTWQNGTEQNATHLYFNGGIYTVSEYASNPAVTNVTTLTNYITIYNQTVTGFTANVTNGSISHGNPNETSSILFNVTLGNDNATQWNWSFGDGNWTNGTTQNVTYTYLSPGNYTVTEIASNAGATNTTTIIDFIHIYPHIIPAFTANVTSGLNPFNVGFNVSNPADSATMWNWSFGDGTWQNGTNQNATHIYTNYGLFTVTEIASNPGDSHNYTLFDYITVDNKTISGFTANVTSGVELLNVSFNVTTGNDNATMWNWSFGDGFWQNGTDQNATHVYSNGGIYTVTEIASNPGDSNTTTLIDYITVYNRTLTEFNATILTNDIEPTLVQFNVTHPFDNATQWNWSFGNGVWQNGTEQNVTYVYSNGGIYTITEIASNGGDSNTTTIPNYVTIHNHTISGFIANVTTGDEPLAIIFNVTSGKDNATMWNWSFGDGTWQNGTNPLVNQNVTHVYSNGGIYTISEYVSDGPSNNVTILNDYITVYNQTYNTITPNTTGGFVPLSISATSTNDTNTTWRNWSTGDGAWFNNTNSIVYTYLVNGNYSLNFTTSEYGHGVCITTQYINASFYAPSTSFTASPEFGNAPLTVQFTDTTLNGPTGWNWSFDDGSPFIFTKNTSHTFTSVGIFTVNLTTSNLYGSTSYYKNITVLPSENSIASFTVNPNVGAAPLSVTFTDTSSSNISSWNWDFGDGTTDIVQNPTHIFTNIGTYNVRLTVTNDLFGGTNTSSPTPIYVVSSPVPIVDFSGSPTIGSAPLSVQFTDLSAASGGITGWNWSFGDGNYSNNQNPTHVYVSSGQYSITLVVSSGVYSNYSSKIGYVNIGVPSNSVSANFTASPLSTGSYPASIQFTDLSVCNPACTNWAWDLNNDGNIESLAQDPFYTYTYPGVYTVKLLVSNGINTGTKVRVNYVTIGPVFVRTTIPQPTKTWHPGYEGNGSFSFKSDMSIDLANSTYLKYWLQHFSTSGNFSVYGFAISLMAPLMHVFGFWIYLAIWGLYIFAVWIRSQDVTLPLIIGILSMGTFGLLFPKESLPVIIIMFVVCGAIIITKLMKDNI